MRGRHSDRLGWIFDAGSYCHSGRNTAVVAGAGFLCTPLVYLPRFRQLNSVPAVGFWITFWPRM